MVRDRSEPIHIEVITDHRDQMVTFHESMEAKFGHRCDFTRGYLTGIVSSLLGADTIRTRSPACPTGRKVASTYLPLRTTYITSEAPIAASGGPDRKYVLEAGNSYLMEMTNPSIAYRHLPRPDVRGPQGHDHGQRVPRKDQEEMRDQPSPIPLALLREGEQVRPGTDQRPSDLLARSRTSWTTPPRRWCSSPGWSISSVRTTSRRS